MSKIGLNIFVSGFTGKLLIRWLEASSPLAEVGRSDDFDFPYDDVYTINNINPVVHIVQLWQSDDGIALTQLIKQWEIDATLYNEISSVTYQYQVDRGFNNVNQSTGADVWADPVNLDTELVDERLDGATKEELLVHEAGYGNKLDADYNLRTGGGIVLLNGKTFDTDVAWFITHTRIITQQANNTGVTTNEIADVVVLTANSNFYTDSTNNHYNKLMIVNGSGNVLTETVQDFALIPNGTRAVYNTHRGSQKYFVIQFDTGDTVYLNGTARNVIYMAKGEEIKLRWHGGVGYVESYTGNDKIRGQVISDWQNRQGTSGAFLYADEATGVLNKADYPGLWAWLESLPPGVCATDATDWATNKRRFMLNTTLNQFRVPHLHDMYVRYSNSANPGVYEADDVKAHSHMMFSTNDNNAAGAYAAQFHSTGGNLGYSIFGSNDVPINRQTANNGSATETRVKNYKQIPLVIL